MSYKRKKKLPDIKTWFIILLTLYSLSVTSLYVWSSIKCKGILTTLGEELKTLNRENTTLPIEARIRELEQQREEVLQEIKDIQEAKKDEYKD